MSAETLGSESAAMRWAHFIVGSVVIAVLISISFVMAGLVAYSSWRLFLTGWDLAQ